MLFALTATLAVAGIPGGGGGIPTSSQWYVDGTDIILNDSNVTDICQSDGTTCTTVGASAGATTALDNLASVAINTSLLSDTADTDSLGSTSKEWLNAYIGDAGKLYFGLGQDASIERSAANEMTLTATSGVTVEGVKIDGGVVTGASSTTSTAFIGDLTGNADTVTTITGLAPDTATTQAAQPNITSLGTIASLVATTADINAGTVDATIGGTTPAVGTFTTGTFGSASSLTLGTASSAVGGLIFKNSTNANTVTWQSGATSGTYALTLPLAVAGAGEVLTDAAGDGVLSWSSAGGGVSETFIPVHACSNISATDTTVAAIIPTYSLDDGVTDSFLCAVQVPTGKTGISSINIVPIENAGSAGAVNVFMDIDTAQLRNGATRTLDTNAAAAVAYTSTNDETNYIAVPAASYNGLSLQALDYVTIQIEREGGDVSDTLGQDLDVIGLLFTWS